MSELNKSKLYYDDCGFLEKCVLDLKRILKPIFISFYIPYLKVQTWIFNLRENKKRKSYKGKNLYVSPVGRQGKEFLKKVINQMGHQDFDYLIIIYDDEEFNEEIFQGCQFIRDKGFKWQLVKRHVTPDVALKYDYIFIWDDDIDVLDFDYKNYLNIVKRNNLQYSQPSLSEDSHHFHNITIHNDKFKFGRYTDFVEVMVPVYDTKIWPAFWGMLETDWNGWGFGYDLLMNSILGLKNVGVVDAEQVCHTKALRGLQEDSGNDFIRFRKKHKRHLVSKFVNYGSLK